MFRVWQYEMDHRVFHCTEILSPTKLVVWGGEQDGLPLKHYDEDKIRITSKLDVFNLKTFKWNKAITTGTPPAAVMECGTATIGGDVYVFGGRCDGGKCSHNDLHVLKSNNEWSKVHSTGDRPMAKYGCGLISYIFNDSNYLLTKGGRAQQLPPEHQRQQYSQYTFDEFGVYNTNEVHIMNITTGIIYKYGMK